MNNVAVSHLLSYAKLLTMKHRKVTATVLLLIVLSWPLAFIQNSQVGISTVQHQDELFIFITEHTTGWSGGLFFALVGFTPSHILREDLIVYHLKGHSLTRSSINDLPFGSPLACEGQLYYGCISRNGISYSELLDQREHRSRILKWNGTTFEPLPAAENTRIAKINATQPDDGFENSKDWKLLDGAQLRNVFREHPLVTRTPIELKGEQYVLIVKRNNMWSPIRTAGNYSEDYSLECPGPIRHIVPLYTWNPSTRRISIRTYKNYAVGE